MKPTKTMRRKRDFEKARPQADRVVAVNIDTEKTLQENAKMVEEQTGVGGLFSMTAAGSLLYVGWYGYTDTADNDAKVLLTRA